MDSKGHWQKLTRKRGFTLVEVLVACALVAVLAMGFSSLLVYVMRAARNVQISADATALTSTLLQVILNDTVCKDGFRDSTDTVIQIQNPAALSVTPVEADHVNIAGTVVLQKGQPPAGLRIKKMSFNNRLTSLTPNGGLNMNILNFYVEAEKLLDNLPPVPWTKDFTITVGTDPTAGGQIKYCGGGSTSMGSSGPGSWTCTVRGTPANGVAMTSCIGNEKVFGGSCVCTGPFGYFVTYMGALMPGGQGWTCNTMGSCGGPGVTTTAYANCCH